MARVFTVFCCFIVGLQLLIGVPMAVCVVFFALFGGLGPIAIEIHPGPSHSPHMFVNSATIAPPSAPLTIAPPPNIIPTTTTVHSDNAILESRAQQGSPLAGTILAENEPPEVEHNQFVAALQKVAAEAAHDSPPPTMNAPANAATCTALANNCCDDTSAAQPSDQFVIQHLYEMANIDEQAGNYDRADQWRALAREIRQPEKESPAVSNPSGNSSASAEPPALDLP
jgi:hypothetical protein